MDTSSAVAVDEDATAAPAPQWVAFRCDRRRFVTPLDRVREILPPLPFTRIPGCGAEVCGLVGARGRVLTVFDLGSVLGLRPTQSVADHRLLILDLGDRPVAVAVDEVLAVTFADLQPDDGRESGLKLLQEDVLGSCRMGEEQHVALSLDRIVIRLLD